MIKGILFDYDSTLSSRYESAYWMYRRMMKEILPQADPDSLSFEAMIQHIMVWDQYGTVKKTYVLEKIRDTYAPGIDIPKWNDYWYAHFHECQVIMPHAREILAELKEKYRLGLVTHGNKESQMAKVYALGLDKYFDFSITSGEFGKDKPDPAIFRKAAEEMGLACEEIAFIGDTFWTDIYGALASGMKAVWLCYEKKTISAYPVTKIHEFEEIRTLFLGDTTWNK